MSATGDTGSPDPHSWLDGFESGHAVASMEAYRQGHVDGYGLGYRQGLEAAERADVENREAWFTEQYRQLAHFLTSIPPYADLAELRGEHDRAERQRQILRERGVA